MSVLANINYLEEIAGIPCRTPDPIIIIKTFALSAPPALLRMAVPGCSEIMQARAAISPFKGLGELLNPLPVQWTRPRRGGRHGKRIKGQVMRMIPPTPLGGKQFLYRTGFFHAEKALWWWLVADVTTGFVAQWQSLMHEAQGCDVPGTGYLETQIVPHTYIPGTSYLSFVAKSEVGCGDARLNEITIPAGLNASIVWGMEWQPWPDPDSPTTNISTWLEEVGVSEVYGYATMNNPTEQNKRWTGGFHKHKNNGSILPRKYRIGVSNSSTNAAMTATLGFVYIGCSGFPAGIEWGCNLQPVSPPSL